MQVDPWDWQVQAGWPPRCAGKKAAPPLPRSTEAGLGSIAQPVAFTESGKTTKAAQYEDPKVTKNIRERERNERFVYLLIL